jgi:hypothetical protein
LISKWAWSKGPNPPSHALIEGISLIRGQQPCHNAYKRAREPKFATDAMYT